MENWNTMSEACWKRLQMLIGYVGDRVPYYKDLLRLSGLDPAKITRLENFWEIPLTEKRTIQERWDDCISTDYQREELIPLYTSGSTGAPLKVVKTTSERIVAARHLMDARVRYGLEIPGRYTILGGAIPFFAGVSDRVSMKLLGGWQSMRISSVSLSESNIADYVGDLQRFQPSWISASPLILDFFCRLMLSEGHQISLPSLQLIELIAEPISPEIRERIASVFKSPPASHYGCQEVWGIAFECRHGQMHVLNDHVYLEVLKPDGRQAQPGEMGEAVITCFNCRSMPFIRYRLGDLIIPIDEPCPCGNPQPLIQIVGGRVSEFIVGHPGKLGSVLFEALMKNSPHYMDIRQFAVVQRSATHFDIWVESVATWSQDALQTFESNVKKALGQETTVAFQFVESIPAHPSGKRHSFQIDLS